MINFNACDRMDKFWLAIALVFILIVGLVVGILGYTSLQQTRDGDVVGGLKTVLTLNDFLTILVIIIIIVEGTVAFIKGKG